MIQDFHRELSLLPFDLCKKLKENGFPQDGGGHLVTSRWYLDFEDTAADDKFTGAILPDNRKMVRLMAVNEKKFSVVHPGPLKHPLSLLEQMIYIPDLHSLGFTNVDSSFQILEMNEVGRMDYIRPFDRMDYTINGVPYSVTGFNEVHMRAKIWLHLNNLNFFKNEKTEK